MPTIQDMQIQAYREIIPPTIQTEGDFLREYREEQVREVIQAMEDEYDNQEDYDDNDQIDDIDDNADQIDRSKYDMWEAENTSESSYWILTINPEILRKAYKCKCSIPRLNIVDTPYYGFYQNISNGKYAESALIAYIPHIEGKTREEMIELHRRLSRMEDICL